MEDDEARRWLRGGELAAFDKLCEGADTDHDAACWHALRSLAESRRAYAHFTKGVQAALGLEPGTVIWEPEQVIGHVRVLKAKADRTAL